MPEQHYSQEITKLGLLIFVLGASFYCYEFFIQVAPAVMSNELMRDFRVNATLFGSMSSFFYFTYTTMQIPSGLILDRFGARITLTAVTLICALGALLFATANNIFIAMLARSLMGLGAGCAFVSALYLTIRWIPLRYFALFAGICQFLGSLGAIGGQAPLAFMIKALGWRHTMSLMGIVGIVLAVIIALLVRNNPNENHNDQNHAVPLDMIENLKTVLTNKEIWRIALYSFSIWTPIVAFTALWSVPFLQTKYHLSSLSAATAISITWLGVALGSPTIGWLSDQIGRRRLALIACSALGFIAISLIIFIPYMPIMPLYLLLFIVGIAGSGQSLSFAVVKENSPHHTTSTSNGFNNMAVVLGGLLFQPLIGKILDLHWGGVMQNGMRIYDTHAYLLALLILPACYLVALITSTFFIKETYCLPFESSVKTLIEKDAT